MADGRKIVSDSLFITVGSTIKSLRGLLFLPIVISCIGMTDYGAFIQIITNVQMISPMCTMALGMGFLRYTSKCDDDEIGKLSKHYWTIIYTSIITSLGGALLLFLLSPVISEHILRGEYLDLLRMSSLLVVCNVLWTQNNKYLKSRKRFKIFSIYDLLYFLFPYVAFVLAILVRRDFPFGFSMYIASKVVISAIIFFTIAVRLRFSMPSFAILKKFFRYSWSLPFSEISGGLLSKADRYFIGYFLGPTHIGIYNIAYAIASVMQNISKPFNHYLNAYMPKLWDSGDVKAVKDQVRQGLNYYLAICAIILAIISFYSEPLLHFVLRKNAPDVENFNLLVFIIGTGIICHGINGLLSVIIRCQQKNHYGLILLIIALLTNVVLNILLIPAFGILGAGIATAISYVLLSVMINFFFSIDINRIFAARVFRIALAGAAGAAFFLMIRPDNLLQLFVNVAIGFFLYTALVVATGTISLSELKRILY